MIDKPLPPIFQEPLRSENISELAKALTAAQGEMKNVVKNAENPFFKSHYADLPTVMDCLRPLLHKHDLALVQMGRVIEGRTILRTELIHSSGQYIASEYLLSPKENTVQAMASANTYFRRHAAMGMTGLAAAEDDDGAFASETIVKKVPIHGSTGAPYCCGNRMMTSKFDIGADGLPSQYYCTSCKKKVPIVRGENKPEAIKEIIDRIKQ